MAAFQSESPNPKPKPQLGRPHTRTCKMLTLMGAGPNSPSLIGLRRPSTAPLPSHLPQESRAYSPDFFYMPPAAADDLMLNAAVPDFSAPAPFMEVSGFSNAFQYARRPSRDAMQTHFALEAATACQTPQPLQPTASYLPHPDLSTWSHNIPPVTSQPASEPLLTDTKSAPKILRPPNAWILYRSDKLAEAKNAQGQRTPQAELSKLIAESWRSEKPEVKRSYEKQAELRKQQHEAQYPGSYLTLSREVPAPKKLTNIHVPPVFPTRLQVPTQKAWKSRHCAQVSSQHQEKSSNSILQLWQ